MIEFQHVTKKYGREIGLDDVTFTLESGKIYGLLGPNGSGKSTTLKMIAGLVLPSTGKVIVNGKASDRRIAASVAYLSELDMFYQPFKVKDMINFHASQFADFRMERAKELVQFMNLDPNKKIKQLSKGNRGRLKLVLALARESSVLLLDEPFSGLDPMVRDSIVKSLLSYIDFENQIVIIATHEIDEIEPLLDEVLAMQNGKLIGRHHVEELRETEGISIIEWMKRTFKESRGE
ncbi:ABC transporter ATP-binding protein [Bacillus sp. DTU_2020_1000418_1_SI_GHA_SEK_038]|uniref:ABC transporter ATP-binding protein n=1 Tax=Bacillus sp. DTU_2020_1000418_1_SI_GHA_SEK_038 TaxID=3077585 RepID=UPI0028E2E4BC|nr:ABC transporter ATP-binding protein [Bacillus sp. DTU_2020_1000418_1_SI_GHA_SEK_038]WNS74410.1 ABC transporter ATP-binding protein [Bacillus sp. DTU_2020_1000418_1_SI_GHA_SEK_038]